MMNSYDNNPAPDDDLLYDALAREGNEDQAELLTGEYRKITKKDVIAILNKEKEISGELEEIANKIIEMRLENEDKLFPWPDEEIIPYINQNQGVTIGGGAW